MNETYQGRFLLPVASFYCERPAASRPLYGIEVVPLKERTMRRGLATVVWERGRSSQGAHYATQPRDRFMGARSFLFVFFA